MAWRTVPIFASGVEHSPAVLSISGRTVLGADAPLTDALALRPQSGASVSGVSHCVIGGCPDDRTDVHTGYCTYHARRYAEFVSERARRPRLQCTRCGIGAAGHDGLCEVCRMRDLDAKLELDGPR